MQLKWMGEYREFVEQIIYLCNRSAISFSTPMYFNSDVKITAHEIQIIEYLLEERDEKMSDVAKRLGITRGAFSNNVSKLVEKGCIVKEHRNDNKKNLYLTVTPKGLNTYKQYSKCVYERSFSQMFSTIKELSPETLDVFQKVLKDFADSLPISQKTSPDSI